jgi:flagellar motility protein MotE (MotC chaperone)
MQNTLVKINNVEIIQLSNDLVPIKPICEALGIDESSQRKKIKEDEFFNSVAVLSTATGSDKKEYKMTCLPLKYIFGWLSTINPKNVKEEAKETVKEFRMKCYDALFDSLFLQNVFLKEKESDIEKKLDELEDIRENFKNAKTRLDAANKDLKEMRCFTFEQWKERKFQTSLNDLQEFHQE